MAEKCARLLGAVALGVAVVILSVAGTVPATADGLPLPLRVDYRTTLRAQFGYVPGYELNVPSFDPWNRPFIRSRTTSQHVTDHVHTLAGEEWIQLGLVDAVRRDYPQFVATVNAGGYVSELIEFDRLGRAYTLLEIRLRDGTLENVLLYSTDGCATWRTLTLPFGGRRAPARDDGTASMEHFTGWNLGDEPPLIAVWRRVSAWPGLRASRNRLYVVRPVFDGDRLGLPAPTLVTTRHLGMVQAAGGVSFAATSGGTSFVVWAEVADADASGAPTFVAALDRSTGKLSRPVRVGTAHPPNDVHDTPGICLDGRGYLHVVIGAHSRPFRYVRSVRPLDAQMWTRPQRVLTSGYREPGERGRGWGRQTYASLVCLPDDTLVLAFRQQRAGVDRAFAGRGYGVLCLQCRPAGGEWGPARRLVMRRDRPGYAIFYQKLAVDRRGRLFLSLSCGDPRAYPQRLRPRHRYQRRMVLVSDDGGASWRFARLEDYVGGVSQGQAEQARP